MKNLSNYIAVIESKISGVPCLIGVKEYSSHSGSFAFNEVSDWDYYGYSDCVYDVLDRKGYIANWLDKKRTDKDSDRIVSEITKYLEI